MLLPFLVKNKIYDIIVQFLILNQKINRCPHFLLIYEEVNSLSLIKSLNYLPIGEHSCQFSHYRLSVWPSNMIIFTFGSRIYINIKHKFQGLKSMIIYILFLLLIIIDSEATPQFDMSVWNGGNVILSAAIKKEVYFWCRFL